MQRPTPDFDPLELELHSQIAGRQSACPLLDVLLALDQDVLPAELAGPARAHLAKCPLCTMLLADMATLPEQEFTVGQQKRVADSLPMASGRSSSSGTWGRALLGLAAALLIAVSLFVWIRREKIPEVARTEVASAPVLTQPKQIPFTPLAPPSGPAVLLARGNGAGSGPADEQLLPAFRPYNHGDYPLAAKRFLALSQEYPQSQMILLYLGVSQLALHQDKQAEATLGQALAANSLYDADAVQWYRAIAMSRVRPADVRPLLDGLCKKKESMYSVRSCDAEQSLAATD